MSGDNLRDGESETLVDIISSIICIKSKCLKLRKGIIKTISLCCCLRADDVYVKKMIMSGHDLGKIK